MGNPLLLPSFIGLIRAGTGLALSLSKGLVLSFPKEPALQKINPSRSIGIVCFLENKAFNELSQVYFWKNLDP